MSVRNAAAQPRIVRLTRRIEQWREAGRPGKRMPAALWDAAVSLAREHGAYRVASETGLNYRNLKQRLEDSPQPGCEVAPGAVRFVEVQSNPLARHGFADGPEIEVKRPDGARLRIRIGEGQELDVARVALAFAGDRRG